MSSYNSYSVELSMKKSLEISLLTHANVLRCTKNGAIERTQELGFFDFLSLSHPSTSAEIIDTPKLLFLV